VHWLITYYFLLLVGCSCWRKTLVGGWGPRTTSKTSASTISSSSSTGLYSTSDYSHRQSCQTSYAAPWGTNESVPIQLAQCRFPGLAISSATHTHPFNGPFSGTTQVSRYQKGGTNLDFTEARDSEWQWHQLGQMQVCTLLQTDNHTSIPPLKMTSCLFHMTASSFSCPMH